jgi:hypothetical protein
MEVMTLRINSFLVVHFVNMSKLKVAEKET